MTDDRDFDRLTRAWLDLMPEEAPDRTIAAVLQAVETTPQVRRWIGPALWRHPRMNKLAFLAAAAVVIAVGVGGALMAGIGRGPEVGGPVVPSISVGPSEPPAQPGVPEALRYAWLGDLRVVPGLATDRSVLEFGTRQLSYIAGLHSDVSTSSVTDLILTSTNAIAGCTIGDVGTYRVRLSTGGTRLALTEVDDACSARAAAISGDWYRSDCLNPDNWCLGPLEAGEYPSYFIAPKLAMDEAWAPEFGAIRYTVPDGWAATSDWPTEYFLEPADWYASNRGAIEREQRGIYVASHLAPADESGGCSAPIAVDVGRSADDLAAWLASHPGLAASDPQAISIGGLSGSFVDGAVDPAWSGLCGAAPAQLAVLFSNAEEPDYQRGALVGHRARWIFLDLDSDHAVLITITSREPLFDGLLEEAMPIVESFRFE